jgi:hypothetical protein
LRRPSFELHEITGAPCGNAALGAGSFAAARCGIKKAASAIITINEARNTFFMERGTSPLILRVAHPFVFQKGCGLSPDVAATVDPTEPRCYFRKSKKKTAKTP